MNDNQTRTRQMFVRVSDFGVAHATSFPANGRGKQLFEELQATRAELDQDAVAESSAGGAARQGTTTRAEAREALFEDLSAIRRTARALADEVSGLDDKFRRPPSQNDQLLLTAGRTYLADAIQHSARFIAYALPDDFLSTLSAHIDTLEQAISHQSSGSGNHVASGVAIDNVIDRGMVIVRKLDAITKNTFANDPATLAEWASARHIERAPRRSAPTAQPPAPSQPT
jgi:hypothetical protein